MLLSEIFTSIQGEGRYQGKPVVFVRTSGCTRDCSFCDTKYHKKNIEYGPAQVAMNIIDKSPIDTVVWTGGEPLIQLDEIFKVRVYLAEGLRGISHHLETNGDLIKDLSDYIKIMDKFEYVAISPKDLKTAKRISEFRKGATQVYSKDKCDIKVVTDLDTNKELIPYATMLMPLTVYDIEQDRKNRQKVWGYCVGTNLFYSGRLHVEVWNQERCK